MYIKTIKLFRTIKLIIKLLCIIKIDTLTFVNIPKVALDKRAFLIVLSKNVQPRRY